MLTRANGFGAALPRSADRASLLLKEATMFETLNNESTSPSDRKATVVKISAFTLALIALVALVYIFAFLPYANR